MFNLESSISAWRSQMLAAGIPNHTLQELESHLRDDLEQQILSGLDAQLAFQTAVNRLGSPVQIKTEFGKMKNSTAVSPWPARICYLVLLTFFVALNLWIGDGLREFSAAYCLLLSLALPLFAGARPAADPNISSRWFNTMLAGQISIGVSASFGIFQPIYPAIGLTLAILSCVWFSFQLRRLPRAGIPAS